MYEYIKGPITSLTPATAVIEAAGVGYLLNISLQSYADLSGKQEALLWVHYHVTMQDAPLFYGFFSKEERELFRLLISVSGIGANSARLMLSSYTASDLATAIATGNVSALTSVKGIGTKTAERVIVDLKGKVLGSSGAGAASAGAGGASSQMEEAVSALMVLGFTRAATEKVVRSIYGRDASISSEELIREALTKL